MITHPGSKSFPDFLGNHHVMPVVFFQNGPRRAVAINGAAPCVPPLGGELVSESHELGNRAKFVAVLIGYFADFAEGIDQSAGGWWLEAPVDEPTVGLTNVEARYVVADKNVVGVEKLPEVFYKLLVVGLVFVIAGIVDKAPAMYFSGFGVLPSK